MSFTRLKTTVGGITFPSCVYNASGPRSGTIETLQKIGSSTSGAILSKSATLEKQDGNELPRFLNKIDLGEQIGSGSINSEGLPNYGIEYYIGEEAVKSLTCYNKPYIISLSGLNLEDNMKMLDKVLKIPQISAIELNLACPNIPNKPIIAYDFDQMEEVLKAVYAHPLIGSKPLGVKLAPYFDKSHFERVINILIKYPIKFIVTINTLGNGLFVDMVEECKVLNANNGYGGVGGGFVKPIALSNVRTIYELLEKNGRLDIDIVGVGGVFTGKDAFELILCGAKAVQVSTCHWIEGPSCFDRIQRELDDIMLQKAYSSIEVYRGKLKPYNSEASSTRNVYQVKPKAKNGVQTNTIEKDASIFSASNIILLQWVIIAALLGIVFHPLSNKYFGKL